MNGFNEIVEMKSRTNADNEMSRVIGAYHTNRPGPLLICIGGMHGNEPAGVEALQRVVARLQADAPNLRGKFIALRGNLRALAQKKRYLETDFNRMWTPERMQALRNGGVPTSQIPEIAEQIELFQTLEAIMAEASGTIYVMDLHTTSAASKPFAIFGDTVRNRRFAKKLRVPLILGLEEAIAGTLIEDVTNQGHVALAFEAGQHDAKSSIGIHESAAWLALRASGCLQRREVPAFAMHGEKLVNTSRDLPAVMEVCYRHAIRSADRFRMQPGFVNFQRVREGQLLARDKNDWIWAPKKLNIFMPLYQGLGDDGFFLARPVHAFWLKISEMMRRLRLDRVLHTLPGVSRHANDRLTYKVDTRIARWLVVEIFHLLGYRKERLEDGILILSKRRFDLTAPKPPSRRAKKSLPR